MIKGMTGFGQGQMIRGKVRVLIEIKSVNHRYLDVNYFLPVGFSSIESRMKQILQQHLQRGRVTVSMKIVQKEEATVTLNRDIVKMHMKNIDRLKKEFRIQGSLSLPDFINLPGVLEMKETMVSPVALRPVVDKCFKLAVKGLVDMRRSEGRSLMADISGQLSRMSLKINAIRKRRKSVLKDKKTKLTAEEFRSFQKSSDVNEEISRLQHYVVEMKPLLKGAIPVGKKIDFIAQEMQRETNTIGAKLQDRMVSNAVIALKSKIEKIREQAQNIE